MDPQTFHAFRELVYNRSGIALRDGKEALVCARVSKRMRALGLEDYGAYLRHLRRDETNEEIVQLLDAISTNVTSFFREPDHFTFLKERLRAWHAQGQRRFRLWSAACSSGEEPYSMAMTLWDALPENGVDAKILATDISTRVLQRCREGTYPKDKIQPVPAALRERYLAASPNGDRTLYAVGQPLRRTITFARLNLSEPPFPMQGPLDVVFCRNVMIYFDNLVRRRLLEEIYRLLKPGGFLLVGHAESLTGMVSDFHTVHPSVYVKEPARAPCPQTGVR